MDCRVTLNLDKKALAFLRENRVSIDEYIKDKFHEDMKHGIRLVAVKKHGHKQLNENVRFWFRHDFYNTDGGMVDVIISNTGKAYDDAIAVTHCFIELNGKIAYGCAVCRYPDKMSKSHGRAVAMKVAKRFKGNAVINKTFTSSKEKNDFFHDFCNKNVIFIDEGPNNEFDREMMVH